MLRYSIVFCCAVFLGGCFNMGGKNVPFGCQIQARPSASQDVIDMYFDRVGDLYPDRSIEVDDGGIQAALTLKQYFSTSPPTSCRTAGEANGSAGPCSISGMKDPARTVRWNTVQDQQFELAAKGLADRLKLKPQSPLVVLIHGFRVQDAGCAYADVRNRMDSHLAGRPKPVYLQVHWDGLYSPAPFGVWGEAQVNGFLVGLALRRVLADVPPEVPVRVMTHSSGAFVLSATLGDPAAVFGKRTFDSEEFAVFRANAAGSPRYPIPRSRDLRAALIVPATPAGSYAGGIGPDGHNHPGMLTPAKLVIGLNEKDVGVSKGPINGGWSLFGSTDLGQNAKAFCQLRNAFADPHRGRTLPEPALADFQNSPPRVPAGLFWDSHDWKHYMAREKMGSVFKLLFDADPTGIGDPVPC